MCYIFFRYSIDFVKKIDEEKALVRFFGTEYTEYKAKVPTRIPFIR